MKVIEFDIGETVHCDRCSKDYTKSDAIGGLLFSSKGYCPECAPRILASAAKYGEEQFILARANDGETFSDFILRMRGGNNLVRISGPDGGEVEKMADDMAEQLGVTRG